MGYIEQRKGYFGDVTFRAQVKRKGHPTVSQTFERKSDARAWISEVESKMNAGEFRPANEAKRHTVSEAIDKFIEYKYGAINCYSQPITKLEWFRREIGYMRLSDVSPATIAGCRNKLKSEQVRGKCRTGPTVNRFLSALSVVFQHARYDLYWCTRNPVREIRREPENDGVVRFLSDDEKARLIEACQVDEQPLILPIVVLALSTGMRKNEIRNLRWEDIDLKRGAALLAQTKTKNRTARRVAIRGYALELLRNLYDEQHKDKVVRIRRYIFSLSNGNKPVDFRETWDRVKERAQLENFRFHDLRHSCASYLAMNGASLLEISEVLGHKTLVMVKRYAHMAESHTAGVVERMNERIFGATQ